MGTVGLDWQIIAAGNFSSVPGITDMIMRNTNTGGMVIYDINNNQVTSAYFIGAVGLDWQFAGVAPVRTASESDLVLRNVNTGAFQVYDIAFNALIGSTSLGAVGLDSQLGGCAPSSPTGSPGDSTSQLIQAMAGFGSGGVGDSSNPAFGTEALQQQEFLTTPRHA
jgi:hypothetical protein